MGVIESAGQLLCFASLLRLAESRSGARLCESQQFGREKNVKVPVQLAESLGSLCSILIRIGKRAKASSVKS
jgi:hypothetical protein